MNDAMNRHPAGLRDMSLRINRKFSRGFSLAEMLVVVAIIVILAAILMVFLAHERDNAAVASCEANERQIATAVDSFAVDHGGRLPEGTGQVNAAMFGGPNNPYMSNDNLVDPATGLPYLYTNGPGMCQNPDAEYQIIDQGGHSSDSLLALLTGDANQDAIAFCSDRGLYAFQSSGAGGGGSFEKKH
jgi:prepilin-type N-terminal cleavage/methylation domain-containing protein